MFILDDTIAALASAPGPGGRGIIRCSGPDVLDVLANRFLPDDSETWSTSRIARRHAGSWQLGSTNSEEIAAFNSAPLRLRMDIYLWPNQRSYTGQRQAELHLLSSPPLLEAVLGDLFASGARPAQPGEFTLRAFLAGRMDLLQAEAVLGVIDASDSRSLHLALTQLAGGVSRRLTVMRAELIDLLADLEAGLDFTEEGIEFVSRAVLTERITAARDELRILLERSSSRARHAARPRVVLAGPPNAGKSTLFNALAGRHAALVSPVAGTTRDYLVAAIDGQGISWDLVDTAGREHSDDGILQAAQELRKTQVQQADLVIECIASDEVQTGSANLLQTSNSNFNLVSQPDSPEAASLFSNGDDTTCDVLRVLTKCDLAPANSNNEHSPLQVSAHTGAGLVALRQEIARALSLQNASDAGVLGSTLARCRDSLERATAALTRAVDLAVEGGGDEFLATDVREALDELGQITGAFYTDDLLDRIFSKFCIGK